MTQAAAIASPCVFTFDRANGVLTSLNANARQLLNELGLADHARPTLALIERRIAAGGQVIATAPSPAEVGEASRELRRTCLLHDGTTLHMSRIWSDGSNPVLLVEIAKDEREAEFLKRQLSELLAAAGDAIVSVDADQNIVLFNRQAECLFGYEASEIVGQPLDRLLPEAVRARHRDYVASFGSEGRESRLMSARPEIRGRRRDGSAFPAEAAISKIEIDGALTYMAVVRDLTDIRAAEETIRKHEAQLRAIIAGLPFGIAVCRPADGRILFANEAFAELVDLTLPALLGESLATFYDDPVPDTSPLDRQWCAPALEVPLRGASGAWRWVVNSIVKVAFGGEDAMLCACYDVSEQRRIEQELRRAKDDADTANRAKSMFLANMSHELRTPLNAILGFSEIIASDVLGPLEAARCREYARIVHRSGQHLLNVVNDILDLSRVEAGRVKLDESVFAPAPAIADCLGMVAENAAAASLSLESDVEAGLARLRGDERLFKQIVLNLLSNAIKFTPQKGSVRVSATLDGDGALRLVVADNGIGIAAEDIPKLLKPFAQVESHLSRRFQGTGLGLALSSEFARLHGGSLALESEPGRGTSIVVKFPASRVVARAIEGVAIAAN